MRYFLGIPIILSAECTAFRNHYDSRASVLEPHITIIPPFDEARLTDDFLQHIESVVAKRSSTILSSDGILITDSGHVFSMLDTKSSESLEDLYTSLCTYSTFEAQLRCRFLPHIMLGNIKLSWLDEQFVQEIKLLGATAQQFPLTVLRLYKSAQWHKKRETIRDFHFSEIVLP